MQARSCANRHLVASIRAPQSAPGRRRRCTEQFQPFSRDGVHDMYWDQASVTSGPRSVLLPVWQGKRLLLRLK